MSPSVITSVISERLVRIDVVVIIINSIKFILMILAVVYLKSISDSLKKWRKIKDEKNSSISD